ncbi:MAG: hypothetical protein KAR38_16310 [Calditrichia bacterium]|nr:hypothetical protein [Calditrichia bacterium]
MNNINKEPLSFLFEKIGFDVLEIEKIVKGEKYSAVMLKNGNIGVCANLGNKITVDRSDMNSPDLGNIQHRIILTAYYNALLNYENSFSQNVDIFEVINFKNYDKIVMIGLFKPILEKFKNSNIKVTVFDLEKKSSELVPLGQQYDFVNKADSVILTSTGIFNQTFLPLVNRTKNNCDVFLLGPSSIMNKELFNYRNVKGIFGSVFEKYDNRVIDVIANGGGTKEFLKFGGKVFIIKENN